MRVVSRMSLAYPAEVISAACSAVASSANFALARTFLKEKALEAEIMGQPPVGDADWCRAFCFRAVRGVIRSRCETR